MTATRRGRSQELRLAVRSLDATELARLVLDLCELREENQSFAEARLGVCQNSLTSYKRRIDEALCPHDFSKPIRIAAARGAIAEFRKASGDARGLLELMIHYVERGTAFTAEYGDIDERFYASLESMFDRFLTALVTEDPETRASFRKRAEGVVLRAEGIGWGYHDYLADRCAEAFP
jgi:hypothetical protein